MNDRSFKSKYATMPNDKPHSKREIATANRRRQILEAAVACFVEQGYHQTGVREIAKRADISLGNLYNHFAGKTDVLVEIAAIEREETAPYLAQLSKDGQAMDILEEFAVAYTKHLSDPVTQILSLEITSEAIRETEVANLFEESRAAMITALSSLLARGVREGSIRQIADVTETAHLILDIVDSSAFRHGIESVELRKVLDNQVSFLRAAIAAHP